MGLLTAANVVVLLVVYFGLVISPSPEASSAPGQSATSITATPIPYIDVVFAVQNIPRGTVISVDMIDYWRWPLDFTPASAMTSLEDVIGKVARSDLYWGMPIASGAIVVSLSDVAAVGSDVAAVVPPGMVAKTIRLARDELPTGLEAGDRVNVFYTYVEDGASGVTATTALLVDDAQVLWIGELDSEESIFQWRTPTPYPEESESRPAPASTSTPIPELVVPVVLMVSNQDAAGLIWSENNQVALSLVIRSASDGARAIVTPVAQGVVPR